jgi:hypothetical protein
METIWSSATDLFSDGTSVQKIWLWNGLSWHIHKHLQLHISPNAQHNHLFLLMQQVIQITVNKCNSAPLHFPVLCAVYFSGKSLSFDKHVICNLITISPTAKKVYH